MISQYFGWIYRVLIVFLCKPTFKDYILEVSADAICGMNTKDDTSSLRGLVLRNVILFMIKGSVLRNKLQSLLLEICWTFNCIRECTGRMKPSKTNRYNKRLTCLLIGPFERKKLKTPLNWCRWIFSYLRSYYPISRFNVGRLVSRM